MIITHISKKVETTEVQIILETQDEIDQLFTFANYIPFSDNFPLLKAFYNDLKVVRSRHYVAYWDKLTDIFSSHRS